MYTATACTNCVRTCIPIFMHETQLHMYSAHKCFLIVSFFQRLFFCICNNHHDDGNGGYLESNFS